MKHNLFFVCLLFFSGSISLFGVTSTAFGLKAQTGGIMYNGTESAEGKTNYSVSDSSTYNNKKLLNDFLSRFDKLTTGKITVKTFGDFHDGKDRHLPKDKFMGFFLKHLPPEYREEDDSSWYGGSYIKKGKNIIAFIKLVYDDSHDTFLGWIDNVVAVYDSSDGRLLSIKTVARQGNAWKAEIEGDVSTASFEVTQASLPDPELVYEDADLAYYVKRYRYEVTEDGMIQRAKVGETWTEIEKADRTKASKEDFGKFLELFPKMSSNTVTAKTFHYYNNKKEHGDWYCTIEKKFVRTFLPDTAFTACRPTALQWESGYRTKVGDKHILFFFKWCDCAENIGYPYRDYSIGTYSSDGALIDFRTLARAGDLWDFDIKGSIKDGIFVKRRYIDFPDDGMTAVVVKTEALVYTISDDGKINEQLLSVSKP